MDCRKRRRLRRPKQMQQPCPGNQLWGLPLWSLCPSTWAPLGGWRPPPRQGGPSRRAAGSAQPGTAAAGGSAALQGDSRRWEGGLGVEVGAPGVAGPIPEPAGGSVVPGPSAGASGPVTKTGGVGALEMAASSDPKTTVDGGSVSVGCDSAVQVASGSMKTVAKSPTTWVAGRSTAETTMMGGSVAVTTVAASGPIVKVASRSAVASGPMTTGPEAHMTNEIIKSPSFGSLTTSSLPEDSNGVPISVVKASTALAFKGHMAAVAATKRHNKRVLVNGTPAVKLLKLPGPEDIRNPALMEALKAVVAAGGSGWLDPKAVAAVRTELKVEGSCEDDGCRETDGKSSKPQQRTWTPTLLVTERRKKKKPVSQDRAALVNLVQCTEDSTKEPKHNLLGSEDQAEAYSMEPMLSFSPPESPITTGNMVPGGGNFVQAEPKEIWICGHSVILVTKRRASTHPHGLQLGFSSSSAFLYWHGIQAMLWDQLLPLLHEIYYLRSFPSVIVIHLGENDLVQHTSMSLIVKMKNDLGILRRAFPDTHIIWSSLLPRRFWKGAEKPVNLEKAREGINREMSHYCSENGIIFLRHDLITYDKPNMFLPDVDDLSDAGADVFTADLKGALHSCLNFGKG